MLGRKLNINEIDGHEIKNYKAWSAHYAKEAEKLEQVFKLFGFDKSDLLASAKCSKTFYDLTSLAQELKLDNTSPTSFALALQEVISKTCEKEKALSKLEFQNESLNKRLLDLSLFQETLNKDWKSLNQKSSDEMAELQSIEENMSFMSNKLDKYNVQLNEMRDQGGNVESNIQHESLVSDYTSLKEMKQALQELRDKLAVYEDLPPNVHLAEIKINSVREEIELTDRNIQEIIAKMA